MLQLPNGCSCSNPSVFPKNWKTVSASTKKIVNGRTKKSDWRIQYYFRDPNFKSRWPNGKLVIAKGMNHFKNANERREATKILLQNELNKLKAGYNPILNDVVESPEKNCDVNEYTPLVMALDLAYQNLRLSDASMRDIRSAKKYFKEAAVSCGYSNMPVSMIRRKHVIHILESCGKIKQNWSAQTFNHYRAYLMQLFTELIRLQAIEINPVDKYVQKMDIEEEIPELFTHQERQKILDFYKNDKYVSRFLQIFFHSGSRPIELLRIKHEKVDPGCMFFKTKVRKRRKIVEEKRPIKKVAVRFWKEALNETKPGEYLFGRLLVPGAEACLRDYITKKWQRDVKNGLGINKNMYWLKHTNLDETSAILDAEAAARQAGHKSTVITLKHYLVNEEEREMERLREVSNKFA